MDHMDLGECIMTSPGRLEGRWLHTVERGWQLTTALQASLASCED